LLLLKKRSRDCVAIEPRKNRNRASPCGWVLAGITGVIDPRFEGQEINDRGYSYGRPCRKMSATGIDTLFEKGRRTVRGHVSDLASAQRYGNHTKHRPSAWILVVKSSARHCRIVARRLFATPALFVDEHARWWRRSSCTRCRDRLPERENSVENHALRPSGC